MVLYHALDNMHLPSNRRSSLLVLAVCLLSIAGRIVAEDEYEWGGMFEVSEEEDYIWVAEKVGI